MKNYKPITSQRKMYNSDTRGAEGGGKIIIASPESSFKIDQRTGDRRFNKRKQDFVAKQEPCLLDVQTNIQPPVYLTIIDIIPQFLECPCKLQNTYNNMVYCPVNPCKPLLHIRFVCICNIHTVLTDILFMSSCRMFDRFLSMTCL